MRTIQSTFLHVTMTKVFRQGAPRRSGLAAAVFAVGLAASAAATPALADDDIGGATTVVNLVTGDLSSGDKVSVVQGDQVFRDEGVKTDDNSSARLVLRDNTDLLLGPSSSIKLDRFVYAGPKQPGAIAINLVKGAFRFATGDADKKAYVISTPTASLGVRGTVLEIVSDPAKTFVVLGEGGAVVCMRSLPRKHCLQMTDPGQAVEVTATGIRWNSGAAAAVTAIIEAIPNAPSGPSGPSGQHASVTPTTTTTTTDTVTVHTKPGGCGGDGGDGGDGGEDSVSPSVSGSSGPGPGPGGHHGPGHGPGH